MGILRFRNLKGEEEMKDKKNKNSNVSNEAQDCSKSTKNCGSRTSSKSKK